MQVLPGTLLLPYAYTSWNSSWVSFISCKYMGVVSGCDSSTRSVMLFRMQSDFAPLHNNPSTSEMSEQALQSHPQLLQGNSWHTFAFRNFQASAGVESGESVGYLFYEGILNKGLIETSTTASFIRCSIVITYSDELCWLTSSFHSNENCSVSKGCCNSSVHQSAFSTH